MPSATQNAAGNAAKERSDAVNGAADAAAKHRLVAVVVKSRPRPSKLGGPVGVILHLRLGPAA